MEAKQERNQVPTALLTALLCWHLLRGMQDHLALGCSTLGTTQPALELALHPTEAMAAFTVPESSSRGSSHASKSKLLALLPGSAAGGLWQRIAALSCPQALLVLNQPTELTWTIQKHIVPYQVFQELVYFQLLSSSLQSNILTLLLCLRELLCHFFPFLPPDSSLCFQLRLEVLHFPCKHTQKWDSESLLASGPFSVSVEGLCLQPHHYSEALQTEVPFQQLLLQEHHKQST